MEEDYLAGVRRRIEEQYDSMDFDVILCREIHTNGLTFNWIAEKWGISVTLVGELIYDHCKRLEELPVVNHAYIRL